MAGLYEIKKYSVFEPCGKDFLQPCNIRAHTKL
jgi:hypothetical protein